MQIKAAVSDLTSRGQPVLLVDTCSLLDLVRSPARREAAQLSAAIIVASAVGKNPTACSLVIASVTTREYADNVIQPEGELRNYLTALSAASPEPAEIAEYTLACAAFGRSASIPPAAGQLSALLRGLADQLLARALRLDHDDALLPAAYSRCVHKRRPARKGQWKDSMVVEETLALASGLRAAGHSGPIVLLSSNVNDYCYGRAKPLHADLAMDFVRDGVLYARDWPEAVELTGL